ncbi:MAG: exodeoxyribonuclease VII small subunit [Clostridia bacterium]|nr:exodeoxyribonuclease VII small subunit [Clostridia bacterium]
MTYEETVEKLEEIVEKLNRDKIGIEESLSLYSEGIELAKLGLKELNAFKGKIELLNKDLSLLETPTETDDEE